MLLVILAVPMIFIGGCLTAIGVMGSMGNSYIAAGHTSSEGREPHWLDGRNGKDRKKGRIVKIGLKLLLGGVVLLIVANF